MSDSMKYPAIARSDYIPHKQKKDEDDHIDLNLWEEVFSDGRPYRAESWAAYQMTFITYYFSVIDMENYTNQELKEYLIDEGVIEFDDEFFHQMGFEGINCSVGIRTDKHGNNFWEVTIIIGDEDGIYARDSEKPKWYKPSIEYKTQDNILYSYISDINKDIAVSTMRYFKKIKAELSGNDSPLKNVWEEFCVQVQDEHSFSWDAYEKDFKNFIWQKVDRLKEKLKKLMWFCTEKNIGEEDDRNYNDEDVVEEIFNWFVCDLANKYSNRRIEKYLDK